MNSWSVPLELRKDPASKNRRRRRLALLAACGLLLWSVFGGDQGLVSLGFSWHERWSLSREIEQLKQENLRLAAAQASLIREPARYEKTARETLMLKKPGEMIYRFRAQ